MKFDKNKINSLFSNIEIPSVFFSEYLPNCNSEYIKVYLYILFLSQSNKEIKLTDLTQKLNIQLETFQNALHYWEDLGLLTKKTSGYTVNNLQDIELYKLFTPKLTSSPEDIQKNTKINQNRLKAIEHINNNYFQGVMTTSWFNDIDLWFSKYNFSEDVMITLFGYCSTRSLTKPYIEAVAKAWSKEGIQNFSELEKYFEKEDKTNITCKKISKKLKLARDLSTYEQQIVEKWLYTYQYDLNIIELALQQTTSITNINFKYIDAIISSWYKKGLKTIEDIQQNAKEFKDQKTINGKTESKSTIKKNNYSNYEQRTFFDINKFYANK